MSEYSFFMSSPHSGEAIPEEVKWLSGLSEEVLMCDVDRYIDQLYSPVCEQLNIPFIKAHWHRYVVDLNRFETDVDPTTVKGLESGPVDSKFASGVYWAQTTQGQELMSEPISLELHNLILERYFRPFHQHIKNQIDLFKEKSKSIVYHLDVHSMPSQGTRFHKDNGGKRKEIVISDLIGKSANDNYVQLVIESYKKAGFDVAYNDPYVGGRITEMYGQPQNAQQTIQVELRRDLYMNEKTKQKASSFEETLGKLSTAVSSVVAGLGSL